MTTRLVALMSFVLLLSLAAFALLVNRYQDEVMGEVARAVTAAGRATLLQFEAMTPRSPDPKSAAPGGVTHGEWVVETATAAAPASEAASAGGPKAGTQVERRVQVFAEHRVESETRPGGIVVLRVTSMGPTGTTGALASGPHSAMFAAAGESLPAIDQLLRKEIRLPLPTRDFEQRFAQLRRRSLLLFLAVFLVGTALSAALALRFTRPVRKLDEGLRRLADGDLDVAVEVRGRDEIGRLATGFNEVARRLRLARERERELARREKLSALGRLAAGVAHDVRNPLHSIGLTLQHLQESCRPEDAKAAAEQSRLVAMMRDEIHRLDRLVDNFLRFARSERRDPQPTQLADLVREIERLVEREAVRLGITIRLEVEPDLPLVQVDAESVRAAILNLVLNAFAAMAEGGQLQLLVRRAPGAIEVAVSDDGTGIPAGEHERVFEFAYTTREGGSGLGLAMVHQTVVEDHGGRVLLESKAGEGTRIRLLLPLAVGAGAGA